MSKKTFNILASGVVVLALVVWVSVSQGIFSPTARIFTTEKTEDPSDKIAGYVLDAETDSDGDGVMDWEEILWGTNPYTPDTDNDGVPDDVEIKERKESGAQLPRLGTRSVRAVIAETFLQSIPSDAGINKSKEVMENYLQEYLQGVYAQETTGKSLDSNRLTESLLSQMQNTITDRSKKPPEVYVNTTTFRATTNVSTERVRRYLNEMGTMILASDAPKTPEFQIINEVVGNYENDGSVNYIKLRQLRHHSEIYLSYATRMRDMEVPETLLRAHADMANSFIRMSIILEDVMRLEGDPLRGFAAANEYVLEMRRSTNALRPFVNTIKVNQLTFSDTEGGRVFAQYTSQI